MKGVKSFLKSIKENTQNSLNKVEDRLDQIDKSVEWKFDNKFSTMKEDLMDELTSNVKENLQSHVRDEVKEIEDQKQRTFKIILNNKKQRKDIVDNTVKIKNLSVQSSL